MQLCMPNIHTEEGKQCMNSHDITVLIELHQLFEQSLWQPSGLSLGHSKAFNGAQAAGKVIAKARDYY